MRAPFIEFTVVSNSGSSRAGVWTALVRRDQIMAVEDISDENITGGPKSRVTLSEPSDIVNSDDDGAGVLRGQRELAVKQDIATIKAFLEAVSDGCGCCG